MAKTTKARTHLNLKTSGRVVVVLESDTHGGSEFGLLNPETRLENPNTGQAEPVKMNAIQANLWQWHMEDVENVRRLADGYPLYYFHLGDATQGNKFGVELTAANMAHQIQIAFDNFKPWLAIKELIKVRQIVGTGVHEFGQGGASILLTQRLRDLYPKLESEVLYHALATVQGVEFDLAHHGPGAGARHWLGGNELRLYVRSLMMDDVTSGRRPPDFVIRGHVHHYTTEVVSYQDHETRGLILPAWQYPYEYVRKAAKSPARATFGTVAIEIENGKVLGRPNVFKRTVDHRVKEVL